MSASIKPRNHTRSILAILISISLGVMLGLGLRGRQQRIESTEVRDASTVTELAADGGVDTKAQALFALAQKTKPLQQVLGPPHPGDWLISHKEFGQNFLQYLQYDPVTAKGTRNKIYIQPLGPFNATQKKIVDLSSEFMALYFGVEVKVKATLPISTIPNNAQRIHPTWGMKQILSTHVLDQVLRPRLPDDAAAFIAFTAVDLYPEPSWNFVFGQASLIHRVGVWSIFRNGDPTKDEASFRLCLLRTLKTATHETGHMFSIKHCILNECNMCGSNNREESDRRPINLCNECLPKLWWATDADPVERFKKLATFCEQQGLKTEHTYYKKATQLLLKK